MTDTIFKPGEYVTRDGRKARVYATDGGEPWVLHGAALTEDEWLLCAWQGNGASSQSSASNLMPPKQVRYVNVYSTIYDAHCSAAMYESRGDANHGAGANRIACIRIEFEEGQFDD